MIHSSPTTIYASQFPVDTKKLQEWTAPLMLPNQVQAKPNRDYMSHPTFAQSTAECPQPYDGSNSIGWWEPEKLNRRTEGTHPAYEAELQERGQEANLSEEKRESSATQRSQAVQLANQNVGRSQQAWGRPKSLLDHLKDDYWADDPRQLAGHSPLAEGKGQKEMTLASEKSILERQVHSGATFGSMIGAGIGSKVGGTKGAVIGAALGALGGSIAGKKSSEAQKRDLEEIWDKLKSELGRNPTKEEIIKAFWYEGDE